MAGRYYCVEHHGRRVAAPLDHPADIRGCGRIHSMRRPQKQGLIVVGVSRRSQVQTHLRPMSFSWFGLRDSSQVSFVSIQYYFRFTLGRAPKSFQVSPVI